MSKDFGKLVKEVKQQLTEEEIKQAIRDNTCGGKPVNMDLRKGGADNWQSQRLNS